ncbi:hypothetical protein [Cupriavidus sp. AU9028]|uniref:hypothetical protein n=1 Tax=Cupriavidus sp. AU9028 TaxID=2871157 RepID=UPI001C93860E|nr:hypothetical protein [Cupriavidus sp. AU9028]
MPVQPEHVQQCVQQAKETRLASDRPHLYAGRLPRSMRLADAHPVLDAPQSQLPSLWRQAGFQESSERGCMKVGTDRKAGAGAVEVRNVVGRDVQAQLGGASSQRLRDADGSRPGLVDHAALPWCAVRHTEQAPNLVLSRRHDVDAEFLAAYSQAAVLADPAQVGPPQPADVFDFAQGRGSVEQGPEGFDEREGKNGHHGWSELGNGKEAALARSARFFRAMFRFAVETAAAFCVVRRSPTVCTGGVSLTPTFRRLCNDYNASGKKPGLNSEKRA